MKNPRSLLMLFSLTALMACSAAEVASSGNEEVGDEDFTAAEPSSEPLRSELVLALKKVNRAALLPSKVAFLHRPGAYELVQLDLDYVPTIPDDGSLFAYARDILSTRGLRIVGKNVAFNDCKFAGSKDYLGLASAPPILTTSMTGINADFASEGPIYSAADFATAKAIEATISYKLTLTKERMAVYLGKVSGQWKIVAIDYAEFACDA